MAKWCEHTFRDQTLAMVRAVLRGAGEPVSCRWIEVRVWADNFTPKTIMTAPDTFDIRNAVHDLVESGEVARHNFYLFSLVHKPFPESPGGPVS